MLASGIKYFYQAGGLDCRSWPCSKVTWCICAWRHALMYSLKYFQDQFLHVLSLDSPLPKKFGLCSTEFKFGTWVRHSRPALQYCSRISAILCELSGRRCFLCLASEKGYLAGESPVQLLLSPGPAKAWKLSMSALLYSGSFTNQQIVYERVWQNAAHVRRYSKIPQFKK